jgi:hypothetical protein
MPARLRSAVVSAGAVTLTAVAVLGAATPAFAKSDTRLSGPPVALVGHAFRLTVSVGDDAGARPARTRLQLLGAHGRYQWLGSSQRLRLTGREDESFTFTLTESRRGTFTFRAVVGSGYANTNPVTVAVR